MSVNTTNDTVEVNRLAVVTAHILYLEFMAVGWLKCVLDNALVDERHRLEFEALDDASEDEIDELTELEYAAGFYEQLDELTPPSEPTPSQKRAREQIEWLMQMSKIEEIMEKSEIPAILTELEVIGFMTVEDLVQRIQGASARKHTASSLKFFFTTVREMMPSTDYDEGIIDEVKLTIARLTEVIDRADQA